VEVTLKDQIEHFFTYYKDLDEGKWVKIDGWGDAEEAKKELQDSFNAYQK
jgi:inorganic pyrophosphatase